MKLFGLVRHSPDELMKELCTVVRKPYFFFLPFGTVLPNEGVDERFIIIPTAEDFLRSYRVLNTRAYEDKFVFVFGSELTLTEFEAITYLDATRHSIYDFTVHNEININLIEVRKRHTPLTVNRVQESYVNAITEVTEQRSVFQNLMTYIYTLPAKTHQKPMTLLSCIALRNGYNANRIRKELASYRKNIGIRDTIEETLVELLTTPTAERMKEAFSEVKAKEKPDLYALAEKYDVAVFELSYVLNSLENQKQYKANTKQSIDDRMTKK